MEPPDCLLTKLSTVLFVLFQAIFDVLANIFGSVFKLFDAFTKAACQFGNFFSAEQQEERKEDEDHLLSAQAHNCENA